MKKESQVRLRPQDELKLRYHVVMYDHLLIINSFFSYKLFHLSSAGNISNETSH